MFFFAALATLGVSHRNTLHVGEWTRHPAVEILPSHVVEFTISIKQRQLEMLYDTALAVSTPGNPEYGKYLTPAQISALTAPASSDVSLVTGWLNEHGVAFTKDKEMLKVRTSVDSAARLLQTEFHAYRRASDGRFIVRAGDYEIPSELPISAIFGLHGAPLPVRDPLMTKGGGGPNPQPGQPAKVTPSVLAQVYHAQNPYVSRGGKGKQAVAEFQGQFMSKADLTDFFKAEVPSMQTGDDQVEKFVGVPYQEGHGVEALLDIEFIMGVAPGVATEFWEWPNNDFCGDLHDYTQTLLQPGGPLVNSISYGWQGDLAQVGCHPADQQAVDLNWAKLAAAGITVFISSGDSGSQCITDACDTTKLKKGVQVVGDVDVSRDARLEQCCGHASQEGKKGFTWTPPSGSEVSTVAVAAALAMAYFPTAFHGGLSSAPSPPVPPMSFDKEMYHVAISVDPTDFPTRDIHILDGTLPSEGGSIQLHSANGTFPDTTMVFSAAYVNSHIEGQYFRNVSTTLGGGTTFKGRAVFFAAAKKMVEVIWSPPSAPGALLAGEMPGRNPPPPPPQGNCTIYSTVTSTVPSKDPKAVSGGSALVPASVELWPSWPASSPWVTAVGATRFLNQTVGQPEMATDQFGSGGGFSSIWNQSHAQWQADAVAKYVAMGSSLDKFPPSGSFPPLGRATPDISALGEGYQVYVGGRVEPVGGTSASSPAFAGYVSLLNEARFKAGKPQMGFFNPFAYQNPGAFTDVTHGTNAIDRGGGPMTYGFAAAPGWDAATGLGTPRFDKLLAAALAA